MQRNTHKFTVLPKLPENLKPLHEIAYNLWWTWNHRAIELFRMIDPKLWEISNHNPVKLLGMIPQEKLENLSKDEVFISQMIDIYNEFLMYKEYSTWYNKTHENGEIKIAYFSMEYGLHSSILMYSGGLGVLAGCHVKSSSEIGIPLIAIGILYTYGGFNQYLTSDGWQMEKYNEIDFTNIPVSLIKDLVITIPIGNKYIYARVWKMDVGRISLYLLDTNFEMNQQEDRKITYYLYDGDINIRIKQEILLGIGGMKVIEKLNLCPCICHMNEGHSAFLSIERYRIAMEKFNLKFNEAYEFIKATNIFTTHTPVPAGNEIYDDGIIEAYLQPYCNKIGIDFKEILSLGKINPAERGFCMPVFALKNSIFANGVSKLHGKVSRRMWKDLWKDLPEDEIPISHVTNGVHINSWISDEFSRLFDRYLGPRWKEQPEEGDIWERIDIIPDYEVWRAHQRLKERLISFIRERLKKQYFEKKFTYHTEPENISEILDPDALTIGFARRFAEYKRAFLIFKDLDRLSKILNDPDKPVQIVISGKAHQADNIGKSIIKQIIQIIRRPEFSKKVVFIEDYDLNVAQYLVQGVDVWLNNPRRPLEASGTSGMKAAINGVLNCSILDGWWDEAFNGENGWAIGSGEEYGDNHELQDKIESIILYDLLENEIIPSFYDRSMHDIPRIWVKKMKNSIKSIAPFFNTNRMVQEYTKKFYDNAVDNLNKLRQDDFRVVKDFAQWKNEIIKKWDSLEIKGVTTMKKTEFHVGEEIEIKAEISLGELKENDISVEIFYGKVDNHDNIIEGEVAPMNLIEKQEKLSIYSGKIKLNESGTYGFHVRVIPYHEGLLNKLSVGLIKIA